LSKAYNSIYIYCEVTAKYAKESLLPHLQRIISLLVFHSRTIYSSTNDNIVLLTVSSKKEAISYIGLHLFPNPNSISLFMLTFGRTLFA